jgi:hypothetical protein
MAMPFTSSLTRVVGAARQQIKASSKTGYGQGISHDAEVLRQERKIFIFSTDFFSTYPLLT